MTTPSLLTAGALGVALAAPGGLAAPPSHVAEDDVPTWRVQTDFPQGSWSYENDIGVLAERSDARTHWRLRLEVHGVGSFFRPTKYPPPCDGAPSPWAP